ncbi:MAG: acetyl-CoA carboxylase, biotin carboxyl carrier protein [Candidatus Hydrothermota bacterium]|nr:MAG: acetyl-CoA carboxylase, biotin carboxyl carrier protein [Candidatus Hydrothermae bacterium]
MKLEKIKELIKILEENGLAEIEVSDLFTRVRIVKVRPGEALVMPQTAPAPKRESAPQEKPQEKQVEEKRNLHPIKSPIVGTFYRAPAPDADPFVQVGDIVKKGQVLCIVEAMKVMNEIESDINGKVVEILVENAQPVEYGQVLFLLEPLE